MRILTWSIRQGGTSRLPGIVDYIRFVDADVVVFAE
jgi:hypothetical protein